MITLKVNKTEITVESETTVAAAILGTGENVFRQSIAGRSRGPLCGMGICFECRVTINGVMHQRSCTAIVEEGMEVVTGE